MTDIAPADLREAVAAGRKQAWSPFEVWRTRVKTPVRSIAASQLQSRAVARQLQRDCRTHTKHSGSREGLRRLAKHGAHRILRRPIGSDAARLLAQRLPLAAFPEPLESEFRTEHRARLRLLEPARHHRRGVHGHRLRHSRSLRAVRRALAHHQHGALRDACARGHPHAGVHVEALLRPLVRPRHRHHRAGVRHRHGDHGGVFAARRGAADGRPAAAGLVLLLLHAGLAAARSIARQHHRVRAPWWSRASPAPCPPIRRPT